MSLKGSQVLVIEDAPDVRDVLTMLLRIEGADVASVNTGHTALALLRRRHFDVVVTDLGLPDIPGDMLIRTINAAVRRPVTVVVITGESEPVVTRAEEAGARVIFKKPFRWDSIVAYLEGVTAPRAA